MSKEPNRLSFDDSDQESLDLLRTKGLGIKKLDEPTKQKLRSFMFRLHHERGVSLSDIANLIGNKTSGYTSWLCRQLGVTARPFEESRLKSIREKRRKYERKPFDGTEEDKAYLLGLRHGDLSVSKPWRGVVRVSTSTTHPAMAELFHALFGPSGHVYQHPRFKKDTGTYEWNFEVILDESFEFLFMKFGACWKWVLEKQSRTLAYLAGLVDSEGSIGIYPAKRDTALTLTLYNTNLKLMRFVHKAEKSLGYNPLKPYLDKPKGFRSPGYHIEMKKDYWRVEVAGFDESQSLVRRLPLRHPEKVAKKQLALSLAHRETWLTVKDRVQGLRNSIRSGVEDFREEAELEFIRRHSNKTR